jgi:peptidoglycan-N-acetylglucosamine deacetylase
MHRPLADLSLDLDNKWSYLKTHGDDSWVSHPSYLDTVVPHFLSILEKHRLKITVFVVGQDAVIDANVPALKLISAAGHEIGNHSFHHEPWLQRYSLEQLEQEFDRAEQALARITDLPLRGFRGPGYSLSADVLNLLQRRGYLYDCSTLPTFIGPLARAYYLFRSNLSASQSTDRSQLFGSVRDGRRRLKPYYWRASGGPLLEIPVTTIPILRVPFHFSYLLFLAQKSEKVAELYFRTALRMCWLTGTAPSLLLHPLDFLGGDDVRELEFFPAMAMAGERKRAFIERMLGLLVSRYRVVPMHERAQSLIERGSSLPHREMKFQ